MGATVRKKAPFGDNIIRVSGLWRVSHWRCGELLSRSTGPNLITTEGRNFQQDLMFHGATQKTTWYIAIIEDDITPLITHTYDAWADTVVTESSAYDEGVRQEFVESAASGGVTSNSGNVAQFTMDDTKSIYGAGLVSNSTIGHHAPGDYLYAFTSFAAVKEVVATDVIDVEVELTIA